MFLISKPCEDEFHIELQTQEINGNEISLKERIHEMLNVSHIITHIK